MSQPARAAAALPMLTEAAAAQLAATALGHVTREYPNKLGTILSGPGDARTPRSLHPVFFGSFDWHSCVHGYWLLARLLRLFPGMAPASEIRSLFDGALTPAKVAGECDTVGQPAHRGFERPYGWAWLLKLDGALADLPDRRWRDALAPLVALIAGRLGEFLPIATFPVRVGTHFNTAFAVAMAAEWAAACDPALLVRMGRVAEGWYGGDVDCQAWEPGGDDFLSPALMEAECMRRLLPPARFLPWLDRFLPRLAEARPHALFSPVAVSDRSDGKIAHLDGLNLSRAWCLRSLATAFPAEEGRRVLLEQAADLHLAAGLPHVTGEYMGEHWLASFALLAVDEVCEPLRPNN